MSRSCYICNVRGNNCSCEFDNQKEKFNESLQDDEETLANNFAYQNTLKSYSRKNLDSLSQFTETSLKNKLPNSYKIVSESVENFGRTNSYSNINNIQTSVNMYEVFSDRKNSSKEKNLQDDMTNSQISNNIYSNRISSFKNNEYYGQVENSFNNNSINFFKNQDKGYIESHNNINEKNVMNNPRKITNTSELLNQMRSSDQSNHNQKTLKNNLLNENFNTVSSYVPSDTSIYKLNPGKKINDSNSHNFKFDPSLYTNKDSNPIKEDDNRKPPISATSKSRQASKHSNSRSIYSSNKNLVTTATPQSDTYATLTSTPQMSNRLVSTPIKDQMKFSNKYSSILTREPRSISPNVASSNYNTINSVRKSKVPLNK